MIDNRRLLVVDADPVLRQLLPRYLLRRGVACDTAESLDEGLMLARALAFDAALCSFHMPRGSGLYEINRIMPASRFTAIKGTHAFTACRVNCSCSSGANTRCAPRQSAHTAPVCMRSNSPGFW